MWLFPLIAEVASEYYLKALKPVVDKQLIAGSRRWILGKAGDTMNQFDQEIWRNFVLEIEGNLQELESNLLLFGQESHNASLLNECFRNMQSIKGAADHMGLEQMVTLARSMENLFYRSRQDNLVFTEDVINLIFSGLDRLRKLVQEAGEKNAESSSVSDNIEDQNAILFDSGSEKVDSDAHEPITGHDSELPDKQARNAIKATEEAITPLFLKEVSGPLANVPDWPEEEWLSASQDAIKKLRVSAKYMNYGEVVAALDEWEERLVEALSTSYGSNSFDPGPLKQIWLRLVDLLPGLVGDDKMTEPGKS
jgi:chemotaxis protein histidine kinase CheA